MTKYNLIDINGNFFNKGINQNIDNILNDIEKLNQIFNVILKSFNDKINGNISK